MAVTAQELAMDSETRFRLVAQREQRFLGSQTLAGLHERHHLVGGHRVRARFTGIAAERAIPAVVAAERGERDEDLLGERHRAATAAIAHLAGTDEQIVEPRGRGLDQRARPVVRKGSRHRARSFGRTSWAKRSSAVSAAFTSGRTGSKTMCVTPSAW